MNQRTAGQKFWKLFCRFLVWAFYRQVEVSGLDHLPNDGPTLICANHVNALADALLIQAVTPRPVHPIAKSGLFSNPIFRFFLRLQQAVPIYRRQDKGVDVSLNTGSFDRVYDLFDKGAVVLIFPEGQSHSEPSLQPLKTGAARIALGAKRVIHNPPVIVPIGLTFTRKGQYRSRVLIKIGEPVTTDDYTSDEVPEDVRGLTGRLDKSLHDITLNVKDWEELELLRRVERFFAFRRGKYRHRDLDTWFQGLQRLIKASDQFKSTHPHLMSKLKTDLRQFEEMCHTWSVKDYHLTVEYRPLVVLRFMLYIVYTILVLRPLAYYGVVNSATPFLLTRHTTRLFIKEEDQYDTAKMGFGLIYFLLFWGAQSYFVYHFLGFVVSAIYMVSLPVSATIASWYKWERTKLWQNTRVFFLFLRNRQVRQLLEQKRDEIDALLIRLAKMDERNSASPVQTDTEN